MWYSAFMTNTMNMLLGPSLENRPKVKIVGVSNYTDTVKRLEKGVAVEIVPEPTNKFDPNAVVIRFEGETVGYLPAKFAERVVADMPGLVFKGHIGDVTTYEGETVGGWVVFDHVVTDVDAEIPSEQAVF